MSFNEQKYTKSIKDLSKQIIAMVEEDGGDLSMAEDYLADTHQEILVALKEHFEK